MPSVGRLLESSLYVENVAVASLFNEQVFGFRKLHSDDRFCALSVSDQQVLLLFRKGGTTAPLQIPGGMIPPHDGSGEMHLAFTIRAEDEQRWRDHLLENEIAIESRVEWPRGGSSMYFRDPDRHLLELITPGCWSIY
jgi:catechol 2,3-dioxygenase-like lactoylglutathione lyase family enzyme